MRTRLLWSWDYKEQFIKIPICYWNHKLLICGSVKIGFMEEQGMLKKCKYIPGLETVRLILRELSENDVDDFSVKRGK